MTPINFASARKLIFLASFFAVASSLAHAEAPKVFWHSQPVGPDETVMVQGHAISPSTKVDTMRMLDADPGSPLPTTAPYFDYQPRRIKPLSFGESILNFTIPKGWPKGVYAYRLLNDVQSSVYLVNAPDPWFIHGDQGNRATPGGWVAVYGNSLAISGGTPQLALTKNGAVVKQSKHARAVTIPTPNILIFRRTCPSIATNCTYITVTAVPQLGLAFPAMMQPTVIY